MNTSLDIRHRLLRGLGSFAYVQVVRIFVRLSEVPLLLGFWGAQLYGEWLILAAIPTYFSLSDGGFCIAASNDMNMRSAKGDRLGALAVFQSTSVLLALVSVAVILTMTLFSHAWPLGEWFGFQAIDTGEIDTILFLLICHVLVGFQGGLINGGYWCSGNYPLGMALTTSTQLIEFAGLVAAVAFGGGPIQAASVFLGGRVLGTILTRLILRKATPWMHYGLGAVSVAEIRHLAKPAFASLAFPVGEALNIQGMRLLVGTILGPAAVAVFVPLRTLTNLSAQAVAVITYLIHAELSFAYGSGENGLVVKLFFRSCQVAIWLSLATAGVLLPISPWVVSVWTDGAIQPDWVLFSFLLVVSCSNGVWRPAFTIPYSTNQHGKIALVYSLVYGVFPLVIAYLGLAQGGLAFAGFALLVAETVIVAYVTSVALAITHQRWSDWLAAVIHPPIFIFSFILPYGRRSVPEEGECAVRTALRK